MYVGTFCAFGGEVPIGCKYIGTVLQARINDIIIMAEWSFIMRGRGIFIHTDGMTCRCHASRPVVAPSLPNYAIIPQRTSLRRPYPTVHNFALGAGPR